MCGSTHGTAGLRPVEPTGEKCSLEAVSSSSFHMLPQQSSFLWYLNDGILYQSVPFILSLSLKIAE